MTGTKTPEYQDLERESSNELMEHDSSRVLGRYEQAASDALQAGRGRARMGQLCFEAEAYTEAVEDWLSATECFLRATATKPAAEVLHRLLTLEAEGRIPPERPDLHAALRERDLGLKKLEEKREDFLRAFGQQGHQWDVPDERSLGFLLHHVRELPGYAWLHYAIFRQASDLGQHDLAAKHLVWAVTFAPDDPNLAALLGYLHIAVGKLDRALALGDDFLKAHPSNAGAVRIMLANALASGAAGRPPDQERALEVLQPLLESADPNIRQRIAALALSAIFHYELGHDQEFGRLVQELNRLERESPTPEVQSAIADFRRLLPHPEVNGTGGACHAARRLLPPEDRQRLFQWAKQASEQAMVMSS